MRGVGGRQKSLILFGNIFPLTNSLVIFLCLRDPWPLWQPPHTLGSYNQSPGLADSQGPQRVELRHCVLYLSWAQESQKHRAVKRTRSRSKLQTQVTQSQEAQGQPKSTNRKSERTKKATSSSQESSAGMFKSSTK